MCVNSALHDEQDLGTIACYAAIELDELLRACNASLAAIPRLVEMLMDEVPVDIGEPNSTTLVDYCTIVKIDNAIRQAGIQPPRDVSELSKQTGQITQRLHNLVENPDDRFERDELEELRSFCIALSRSNSLQSATAWQRQQPHPFTL